MNIKYFLVSCIWFFYINIGWSQGTLPVYSDYLSDNVFLIHPSAAGLNYEFAKLRLTHRQQWTDQQDAPYLQTLSYNQRLGLDAGIGGVFFNDKNGYHAQKGFQLAYAYHVNFGRDDALNQLSFGLSGTFVQNSVDQRSFTRPDPVIAPVVESDYYMNADFSVAYFNLDAYVFLTIKNLVLNTKSASDERLSSVNLRRYLLNVGYFFGWEKRFQFEPSLMFQYVEQTQEKTLDINAKIYGLFGTDKRAYVALSYRQSLDDNPIQELSQLSPILGIEIGRYSFTYTYSQQLSDLSFNYGGFHQLTFGINLFGKPRMRAYFPQYNPYMYRNDN
ncbi:type IX secretion system membrane protein PorP/SprF [Flavobacteriaceae bacterium F08102]|nr:type IX secretion system membrane protein PorP/SprF [Flavobacteriaceae bacterium F08102]